MRGIHLVTAATTRRARASRWVIAGTVASMLMTLPVPALAAQASPAPDGTTAGPQAQPHASPPDTPVASATGHRTPPPSHIDPRMVQQSSNDHECHAPSRTTVGPTALHRSGCAATAHQRTPEADRGYKHAPTGGSVDIDTVGAVPALLTSGGPSTYVSPDWLKMQPNTSPSGRYGDAVAYDEAHHQVIAFGGTDGSNFFNDTWVWNGSTWTQLSPSASPSARAYAQMAYDEVTGTIILFGGYATATPALNDTWSWNGTTWTQLTPATVPTGRSDGAMAYDVQTGKLVLFGGGTVSPAGVSSTLNDTWTYDGSNWAQVSITNPPAARSGVRAAYDAANNDVVIFGGIAHGATTSSSDTWLFNGTTWTQASPTSSPSPRSEYFLAYDGGLPGVVLFGGYADGTGDMNDTWKWDPTSNAWSLATGIAAPAGRDSGGMAFDQTTGQLVQFGGYDGFNRYGDTWTYDVGHRTVTDSVSPSLLYRGSLATYTVQIGNPSTTTGLSGVGMTETLPSGLIVAAEAPPVSIKDVGTGAAVACSSCSASGQTVRVSGLSLAPQQLLAITFDAVAIGAERACMYFTDSVASTGDANPPAPVSVTVTICDTTLGAQPWWSLAGGPTGPQGSYAVNVASGNLVVSQEDSTVVADRGLIRFGLTRTYNSNDDGLQPLPATLGAGWVATEGQEGIAGGGVTASGLIVPSTETVAGTLPVTLVDGSGTRLMFMPRPLGQAADLTSLVTATAPSSPLGVIKPHQLVANLASYDHVCVDDVYTPPAGVHLSMWRYIELQAASTSTPCTPRSGTTPAVLGFGAERPDRVRFEFAWDGHIVDLMDGNANELRYLYDSTPSAGAGLGHLDQVSSGEGDRSMSFTYLAGEVDVTDAAKRITRYLLDGSTPARLTTVVNPDGSVVNADGSVDNPSGSRLGYTYGGCSGATYQLCSATDPRNNTTTFTYATATVDGVHIIGPPHIAGVTERGGTVTAINVHASPDYVTIDTGTERSQYISIDSAGRVGEVDAGNTSNAWQHEHVFTWDAQGATCRQPDATVDNNLCTEVEHTLGANPDAVTSMTYNAEGRVLRQHEAVTGSTTRDRTAGYSSEYLEANGSVMVFADGIQGSGQVSSTNGARGTRADANTILDLSDMVSTLTPIGNAAGAGYAAYETTYQVDDNTSVNPNQVNGGGTCTSPTSTTANTGNVCQIVGPKFGGNYATITRYVYNSAGQEQSVETPKAVAETVSGSIPSYTLTYYASSDHDLSGSVSAGGWLKAVTDPTGNFAAYGYDAAGSQARSWDHDATQNHTIADFPGTLASPPSMYYTETLHNTGANAYSIPWRYVLSTRDQLADATGYAVDANGDQTRIRPPRGTQVGSASFDTVQTFDARGALRTRLMPAEAAANTPWQYGYDQYGNQTSATDPNGHVTTTQYDSINRAISAKWTRGVQSSTSLLYSPPSCATSTSYDAPIPPGMLMCSTSTSYDGLDDVIQAIDGNGSATTSTYNALRHELTSQTHRDSNTPLTSGSVYDLDGNRTDSCPPLEFSAGAGACTSTGVYSTHKTYDALDRVATVTTFGDVGAEVVHYGYDADGNTVHSVDPNGHTSTTTFDFLDQRTQMIVPRDAQTSETTTWNYDPAGVMTSVVQPGGIITAYSYDQAHRRIDTVKGSSSLDVTQAPVADSRGGGNIRTRQLYDADGHVVANFDPRAFATSTTSPDARFMARTDYDADGRPVLNFVPRYDSGSNSVAPDPGLGASTNPNLQTSECTASPSPAPQSLSNVPAYPAGVGVCVTRASYDGVGNLTKEYLPTSNGSDNRWVQYSFTDDNLPLSTNEPDPTTASGNRLTTAVTYAYDGDGKQVIQQDAMRNRKVTSYSMDELVTSVTEPTVNITGQPTVTHVTQYFYDANGNTTEVIDGANHQRRSIYYSDNRLQSTTAGYDDPAVAATTSYTYDADGNTTSVMSPSANAGNDAANTAGVPTVTTYTFDNLVNTLTVPVSPDGSKRRQTQYGYDGDARKLSQHVYMVDGQNNPISGQDGGSQSFAYFNDGRMQDEVGRDSKQIVYSYDPAGNMTSIQDQSGAGSTLSATYYLDARLRSVDDGSRTSTLAYDGSGAVSGRQESTDGGAASYATLYTYGDSGLPVGMTAGTTATPATTTWGYDSDGRLAQENDPNGTNVSQSYAADSTLTKQVVSHGSTAVSEWDYIYDGDFRQTSATFSGQSATAGQAPVSGAFTYHYNAVGRIDSYTIWAGATGVTQNATWDHNGDRLTLSTAQSLQHWDYNADGSITDYRVGSVTAATYSYLPWGGTTSDGCANYAYDGFDRQIKVTQTAGSNCPTPSMTPTTYTYDGLDRQRSRTDGNGTVALHYDGLSNTSTVETSGSTDTVYVLDAAMQRKSLTVESATPTTQYLATDGNGDITTVTGSDGSLACTARFDAFGIAQGAISTSNPCSSGSTSNKYFYRGARADGSTGDYQFGSRTYDPNKGGFNTPDSYRDGDPSSAVDLASDPMTANGFAYAGGDPVNFWDPTGHNPCREDDCTSDENRALAASDRGADITGSWAPDPVTHRPRTYNSGWQPPSDPLARDRMNGTPHLMDTNAARTMTLGAGTGLGATIDLLRVPADATSLADVLNSDACANCSGTRHANGHDYKWNAQMATWVCGDHDAQGTDCGESHTYRFRWDTGKTEEYNDGVSSGFLGVLHTAAGVVGALAGACALIMSATVAGAGVGAACGAVALGAAGVSAATGVALYVTGRESGASLAMDLTGLVTGGMGRLAESGMEATRTASAAAYAMGDFRLAQAQAARWFVKPLPWLAAQADKGISATWLSVSNGFEYSAKGLTGMSLAAGVAGLSMS